MGSSFRLAIWENADFGEVLTWAREKDLTTIAADISATKSHRAINWDTPTLVVFGSESHGLSKSDLAQIDEVIRIPMENGVESLNLAVAAGIILFEARRKGC